MVIAKVENSVALGFIVCANPNMSAVSARAIQVPRLSSMIRKSTPRKSTSSAYPAATAMAKVGTMALTGFDPVTW